MTATLTDNEKYLLKRIELLEKLVNKLEWRLIKLELHDIKPKETEISDEEAEELSEDDNWLNNVIDEVNSFSRVSKVLDYISPRQFMSLVSEDETSFPEEITNR